MSIIKTFSHICTAAWIAACAIPMTAQAEPVPSISTPFIKAGYASAIPNWDNKRYPVFYGLIRSQEEFKQVNFPTPVMNERRPFAPEAAVFDDAQILMVSRLVESPFAGESWFSMEGIQEHGSELHVQYRVRVPNSGSTLWIKDGMYIQIPRKDYDTIVFIENGLEIGRLDVKNGQRLVTTPGS